MNGGHLQKKSLNENEGQRQKDDYLKKSEFQRLLEPVRIEINIEKEEVPRVALPPMSINSF